MKLINLTLTAIALLAASEVKAQKPRTKIIKINTTRDSIVYLPDTIPVFFKELIIGSEITERWQRGFVIWQTYEKADDRYAAYGISTGSYYSNVRKDYYKTDFPFDNFRSDRGETYLYENKKKVTNRILSVIKP